ncbi:MAG TPA: hypothetical protein VMF69_28840 [Gemmataceae bacterium]|nr:hypothetical protein [Gemmataceae bacterium]
MGVLMLASLPIGCAKKNRPAETETPGKNPLKPGPGGPTAQTFVGRGAQRQENQQLLRSIGQYYVLYNTEKGRDPRDLKEFLDYLKNDPSARTAKIPQTLEDGWVVMVFTPNVSGNPILAYEKEVFEAFQNRLVLFRDGSVKLMVEPDFQAALKDQ